MCGTEDWSNIGYWNLSFDRLIFSLEEVPGVLRHWDPDNVLVKSSFRHPAGLHEEQHLSPSNILARGLEMKRRRLLQIRVVYLHESSETDRSTLMCRFSSDRYADKPVWLKFSYLLC